MDLIPDLFAAAAAARRSAAEHEARIALRLIHAEVYGRDLARAREGAWAARADRLEARHLGETARAAAASNREHQAGAR